jgi:hypothetical protein
MKRINKCKNINNIIDLCVNFEHNRYDLKSTNSDNENIENKVNEMILNEDEGVIILEVV